jgi:hypothetical protein
MLKELEQLNLTEADFKLLNEGLDCLPNKDVGGDLMIALLTSMVAKDDPEMKSKMESDRKSENLKRERAKQMMMEEVRILQGKILLLQRHLRMNGLLKQANDLL